MGLAAPWNVGSLWIRDGTCVSWIGTLILYHWTTKEALLIWFCINLPFKLDVRHFSLWKYNLLYKIRNSSRDNTYWFQCPQSCLTLWNLMDYSPSSSYVHGIFQAWILDPCLQGISLTQESNSRLLCLLHWQADSLPPAPPGKPLRAMHFQILFIVFLVQSYEINIEHNFTDEEIERQRGSCTCPWSQKWKDSNLSLSHPSFKQYLILPVPYDFWSIYFSPKIS